MIRRISIPGILLLAAIVPFATRAEHTRFWRQSDFSDFQRGTPTGVAIRSDGKITPAPKFDSFADSGVSVLWTLQLDPQGRLYAAGGSDAKVFRFDSSGKPTTVFESSELAAQAISFDAKGNLYVATSPDGKIYKVTPDGAKSTFFDPKAKYIWALAVDSQGDVFAGTGDKGQIFVVTPDGNGKLFYSSDQRHARSLAFDARGNLLVGTEPDGRILRIPLTKKGNAAPEAGAPFVVYETGHKEVASLLVDSTGNIYAAAIGDKSRGGNVLVGGIVQPAVQPAVSAPAQTGAAASAQAQAVAAQPSIPAAALGPSATGAEVDKIATDDSPTTLWSARDQIVLSLALTSDNKLLLGTGNRGEIVRLEGDGIYSQIEETATTQVTSFAVARDGKVYVATANPGKIFAMGPGMQPNGDFVSTTFDAVTFSRWGRITWGDSTTQSGVQFYVRSGNTSNPDTDWTKWTGPYISPTGETITAPAARFVQWKAVFTATTGSTQPTVSRVDLAFQPKNVAPVIDGIAIQEPGVRFNANFSQPVATSSATPAQVRVPQRARAEPAGPGDGDSNEHPPRLEPPPQFSQDHGFQSVYWTAHDDNDDNLVYSIYYRGEGETNWRLLKDKLASPYYSWDTTTMPDGAYYLKIVVSDAPSNPPNEALSTERLSDRFEVGNAPPRIDDLRAQTAGQGATISFGASSMSGAIARASYSVDSADWQIVFPVGQLTDAPRENYRWDISNLSGGEHTVSVRITDRFGNETAAKTTFSISAR